MRLKIQNKFQERFIPMWVCCTTYYPSFSSMAILCEKNISTWNHAQKPWENSDSSCGGQPTGSATLLCCKIMPGVKKRPGKSETASSMYDVEYYRFMYLELVWAKSDPS